ncbi:vanadium-dependent haloperoxidase [Gaoshiqia sp. Z1-71]|uniref:vanadium-dependent haloperoxidase n=1 Tax=Gaoshiqia hydrogeniformans TaxID=3290090 RepID=UPI003BF85735
MKKSIFMFTVLSGLFVASCIKDPHAGPHLGYSSNKVILEWNEVAYQAFGGEAYLNSVMASKINAMTQLAMHDALNAVKPVYATYAFKGRDAAAHPVVAAASAAHTVLVHEIPEAVEFLDSALQQTLATVADGQAKNRGILLGKEAGQAIIDARESDGSAGNPFGPVPPSADPGVYRIVPPFDFVFAPHWVDVKLFGLQSKDQFRSSVHPLLDSDEYAVALNEVKEAGRLISDTRTEDQTATAHFWYEFSEAGWNRVARIAAKNKNLGLWETARLFALLDMALADAYIAGWESKFHYNLWRPYTAIRNAAGDNNDQTGEDALWEPLMPTPPVQDYPSTHSALGNAAATILGNILGDQTPFSMSSPTELPGSNPRTFTGFRQAANENADSRVMAGIHFRFACDAGQDLGDRIGQWMLDHHLKPLK